MAAKKANKVKKGKRPADLGDRIIDAALLMAEADGWESVRLRRVAEGLGISLADVQARFQDLDAVADAWFARANAAMLASRGRRFAALAPHERIKDLMQSWFDALAPHHRAGAQMLAAKLYAPHPHHWVPLIFTLSRTVQWLRDAAGLDARGRRRQVEEVGLSALFLAAIAVWSRDDSPGQERTRKFLDSRLSQADRVMGCLWPSRDHNA